MAVALGRLQKEWAPSQGPFGDKTAYLEGEVFATPTFGTLAPHSLRASYLWINSLCVPESGTNRRTTTHSTDG